jgi:cytochrome c2
MSTFFLQPALSTVAFLGLVMVAPASLAESNVASGLGHDLAQKLCSSCHLVEPGQANPPNHVGGPSFQSVANRPDVSIGGLRKHLKTTHSNAMIPLAMPNPALTEDELVKIIAYILSLRQQP